MCRFTDKKVATQIENRDSDNLVKDSESDHFSVEIVYAKHGKEE